MKPVPGGAFAMGSENLYPEEAGPARGGRRLLDRRAAGDGRAVPAIRQTDGVRDRRRATARSGAVDRVAMRVATRGTHTGEFMGQAATGRQFDIESSHIYRVENGKVAEHWAKRDDLALAQQIGLFEH